MILRNALWNLLGLGLPLLVALVCIPPLVDALGAPRFGALTLVWAVVSYFGLFDLGLGRALTQQVSAALGSGRGAQADRIAGDGLLLLATLGVAAGLVLWIAAPAGIDAVKRSADSTEAVAAARALAWAMPFVLLTSGLRGIMEARGAFAEINVVRLVTGAATFVAPLATVRLGWNDLGVIAWVLSAVRVVGCALYAVSVMRLSPGAFAPRRPDRERMAPLLRIGGWMTVTNVVSPLMSYLDRFVVGIVVSMSAVAWYVTPQEIVTRLLIVPVALTSVLFPRLSEVYAGAGGRTDAWRLERAASGGLFLLLLPVTLLLGVFAYPVLEHWVGPEFANEGAAVMLVLCAGVLVNGLAQVPFVSLQARGGARQIALLHLAELPLFLAAVWLLATPWGAVGAALAWTLRVIVDFAVLRALARPREPSAQRRSGDVAAAVTGVLTAAAFAAAGLAPASLQVPLALALGAVAWTLAAGRVLAGRSWRTLWMQVAGASFPQARPGSAPPSSGPTGGGGA